MQRIREGHLPVEKRQEYGRKIQQERHNLLIPQRVLAERLHKHRNKISDAERGVYPLRPLYVAIMAELNRIKAERDEAVIASIGA